MDKPAPAAHPIHPLAAQRWSPHAFDPKRTVDDKALASLLEAARWSPSSYNEQPWAYVLGRLHEDPQSHARVLSCLVPGNQRWAKDAPVLMIAVAKLNFDRNGKPNRHHMHDVGQSLAWLTMQAESMGLRVHQMAGIDPDACRRELGIPEGWEPATGVAIGYPGPVDQLPDDLKARETAARSRKPLSDHVFIGQWGAALPAVSAGV